MDKHDVKSEKGFRAHNSKGVDKNGAKCNMGFGRISKIYPTFSGCTCPTTFETVLAPHSQLVQDLSSNRFAVLGVLGHVDSETVPASPNALHEAGVFGPSTTLLDELEDDLTRVDDDEVLGGRTESLLRASPHVPQHGRGCEFCTTNTFCRSCSSVQPGGKTMRYSSRRRVEFQIKHRVGGTRDQSFHGLHHLEQQHTRVV